MQQRRPTEAFMIMKNANSFVVASGVGTCISRLTQPLCRYFVWKKSLFSCLEHFEEQVHIKARGHESKDAFFLRQDPLFWTLRVPHWPNCN